jgi:hypothetical protein
MKPYDRHVRAGRAQGGHLRAVDDEVMELRRVPIPDDASDEWRQGWRACHEILEAEWAVWYARGVAAKPIKPADAGIRLDLTLAATGAFIVGFVVAVALLA